MFYLDNIKRIDDLILMIRMNNRNFFILLYFLNVCASCIPSPKQCGCSYQSPIPSSAKIIGGTTAEKHSWPWIVSIRQTDRHRPLTDPGTAICGGSLINEKYALTAAHCFYDINHVLLSNYFIVIGAHYINDTNPVRFKIKSVILHEHYTDDESFLNDIALIELSSKVDFRNSTVGFICLPSDRLSTYPNECMSGFAAGWGRLSENGSASYTLQHIQLLIIPNKNLSCITQINNGNFQFCAGFERGEKDTCQGDSGGPFMIYDSNTRTWNIAGITSYGTGCARPGNPGVYTRVNMYIDWINEHIKRSSQASIIKMSSEILVFLFCIILYF